MTKNSRDSIFRILRTINRTEVKLRRTISNTPRHKQARRFFYILAALPFALALIFLALSYFLELLGLVEPSLVALLIAYIGGLSQPLIALGIHREAIWKALKNPFMLLLDNARLTMTADMTHFQKLQRKALPALELVHLEVKNERDFFVKRIGVIVGAIDKLGLIPGLLAAVISISKIQTGNSDSWILALAYATPALYVAGAGAHYLSMRLDRMTNLLELAISRAKKLEEVTASKAQRVHRLRGRLNPNA